MQRSDRTDEPEETQKNRPSSRRSSVSLPRKNSLKKERKSPLHSPPVSSHSTPKKTVRPSLDFMVTGKQILKRADRANSLPGSYRRQSSDAVPVSHPRATRVPERGDGSQANTREPSLEDDLSLDLSQISDFDDSYLRYGKLPLATSTPKPSDVSIKPSSEASCKSAPAPRPGPKPRSASLQHIQQRVQRRTTTQQSVDLSSRRSQQSVDLSSRRSQQSVDLSSRRSQQSVDLSAKPSRDSTFSYSRDSLYKTSSSASPYNKYGTDYSPVSPEATQSSAEASPSSAEASPRAEPSPLLSSWAERTAVEGDGAGEWSSFWANYNHTRPLSYDQCPTPYRENLEHTDLDWSECSRARSPDSIKHISSIIQREGLRLTPRDTQHVMRCAQLLGSVLSRAVDRRARSASHPQDPLATRPQDPLDTRKRTLTLDLQGTRDPTAEKKSETVMTQTDISLPNTKSAPRIFENILRQLSKSSIDEPAEDGELKRQDGAQSDK